MVPARARPVPFWRHGLPRPPATMPRLLPALVPARRELSSARTASWTRCGLISAAKIDSSSAWSRADSPSTFRTGAVVLATALLTDLHDRVLRAGNGALDEQKVVLGVDFLDGQTNLGDALAAEPAGHADPLEHARGGRGSADRAWLPDVVGAVGLGAAAEVVPLDRAREPLADRDAGDLHVVAGLEGFHGHRLTGSQLGLAAKLDEVPVRRHAGLGEVPHCRLGQLALGHRLEGQLDRRVAVRLGRLHLDHGARPGLDHGHGRHDAALRVEDPSHAQFPSDDALSHVDPRSLWFCAGCAPSERL